MLDYLQSMLSSLSSCPRQQHGYADELKKKMRLDFECSMSLLQKDESTEKKRKETKLKILMTKEAASRLLSKCKNGGKLEYDDVARDLQTTPAAYIRVVSHNAKHE